jgi:hypothetical protein
MITAGATPKSQAKFSIDAVDILTLENDNGVVSASFSGDISLGANKLKTTNLLLKEMSSSFFVIRDASDTVYRGLYVGTLVLTNGLTCDGDAKYIQSDVSVDGRYLIFRARDEGIGGAEVGRLQGAADPYFALGGSQQFKFYNSGTADFGGDVSFSSGTLGSTIEAITLGAGATTFAVDRNVVIVTGDAGGNTIATITGGIEGQTLTLLFVDGLVTISNDDTHGADTVDLDGANNFVSADDKVLTLIYDGTSWYKVSESAN